MHDATARSESISQFWDERFDGELFAYGEAPNRFLTEQAALLAPGMKALSVADGEGRNGVWLAEQGMEVLSVDFSPVGLRKARALAERRNVRLETLEANLLEWRWPVATFDLVASIFIHFEAEARARMHEAYHRSLKPGGLLVLVAFTPLQLSFATGGPEQEELLYTAEMLREDFRDMSILQLEERIERLDEGPRHQGQSAMVHLAARA